MKILSKKRKKNNKGFSLVELIVVVLIIAIIAVALAPQVMKWVKTAKDNVDENNMASIKSSMQIAIADFESYGNVLQNTTFKILDSDVEITSPTPHTQNQTKLKNFVNEVFGGSYPKPSDSSKHYVAVITVKADSTVLENITVSIQP